VISDRYTTAATWPKKEKKTKKLWRESLDGRMRNGATTVGTQTADWWAYCPS
jgi:hypothetical protein